MPITSSAGNQKLEIKNILVGDAWLCSGQSNMETPADQLPTGDDGPRARKD